MTIHPSGPFHTGIKSWMTNRNSTQLAIKRTATGFLFFLAEAQTRERLHNPCTQHQLKLMTGRTASFLFFLPLLLYRLELMSITSGRSLPVWSPFPPHWLRLAITINSSRPYPSKPTCFNELRYSLHFQKSSLIRFFIFQLKMANLFI